MKLKLIKHNENSNTYQAEGFKIVYKYQGKIAGDNAVNKREKIYLITGKAVVTISEKSSKIQAPSYFEIPERTYHKIVALTDIAFIILEE
jgi:hypothetical protein